MAARRSPHPPRRLLKNRRETFAPDSHGGHRSTRLGGSRLLESPFLLASSSVSPKTTVVQFGFFQMRAAERLVVRRWCFRQMPADLTKAPSCMRRDGREHKWLALRRFDGPCGTIIIHVGK